MLRVYLQKTVECKPDSNEFVGKILKLFSSECNCHINQVNIEVSEYGKPYFKDYPSLHFNISHTKGAIVCAISNQTVGIDIEKIKDLNKRIAERFFTKNEQNYIFGEQVKQDGRFMEVWTKKEAYVKWLGKGMAVPFNSFDVLEDEKIKTYYINDHIISVCSESKNISKENLIIL